MKTIREEINRYAKNLRDELDGAALYAALSAAEKDPVRQDLFLQLSQSEHNMQRFGGISFEPLESRTKPTRQAFEPGCSGDSRGTLDHVS